jgi:hypothetical protein
MSTIEACSCNASSLWKIVREGGQGVGSCELELVVSESHAGLWWTGRVDDRELPRALSRRRVTASCWYLMKEVLLEKAHLGREMKDYISTFTCYRTSAHPNDEIRLTSTQWSATRFSSEMHLSPPCP